jgi:hypothetical protein
VTVSSRENRVRAHATTGRGRVQVTLGSLDAEIVIWVAHDVVAKWPDLSLPIAGVANDVTSEADVVVSVGQRHPYCLGTAGALTDEVVIAMDNALVKKGREMLALIRPRGSVVAAVQAALPRFIGGRCLHHLPALEMENGIRVGSRCVGVLRPP